MTRSKSVKTVARRKNMNECGGRSLGKPLCNAALNKALRMPGGGGNGSASSGRSSEWMRRAGGGGGGRDEASAAALRLLLAAGSATAPSPLQLQLLTQPDPAASLSRPAPKPTAHFPTAAGAYSHPGKKLPRWLGVNRHLERRTKGKESHKAVRLGSRGLVSLTPHPLAKCVCGWNAGEEAGFLRTCSPRRTAARAARARRGRLEVASVSRTQPSPLQAAAPPPPSPRRTCCQDARRSRCRCSRPRSCAADGGGRSSESPRPPRSGGGGGGVLGEHKSTLGFRRGTRPSRRDPRGSAPPPPSAHPQPRFPRGRPARLGLPPGAAPRPRPSALRAARQCRRHAEIPEVPPRRPPGHAAARPSPPPSALRARRAFPSTGRIPSSSGRPGDKTFPRSLCQLCPHAQATAKPDARQKNGEKTYPNCNAKV
uniref:formin-like protein 5 n=1 Tax=Odobenus rosmarus divergens TaxID=9708 RepID=UPI00063C01CC|nr:PREDICTED: formin-like protein 5 [Odobenus rosmarus divergens]